MDTFLFHKVTSESSATYNSAGDVGEAVADSEDITVRCYSCGRVMGDATIRGNIATDLSKIKFMLENRVRCRRCDEQPTSTVRTRRS
jgi:hypothetical protein